MLFPVKCGICGKVQMGKNKVICEDCLLSLPLTEDTVESICIKCTKPSDLCSCGSGFPFAAAVAPFSYEGELADTLNRMKEKMRLPIRAYLAKTLAWHVLSAFGDVPFSFVTTVPMSDSSLRDRGFDHGKLLATEVAKELSLKFIECPLIKTGNTLQKTLGRQERFANADSNIMPMPDVKLDGIVLLVDDIFTTGATLKRCSELLLQMGTERVYCATVATTLLKDDT